MRQHRAGTSRRGLIQGVDQLELVDGSKIAKGFWRAAGPVTTADAGYCGH